ncbi:MAG: TraX family protein [Blautia sp.]|jgi:hypothetical protein
MNSASNLTIPNTHRHLSGSALKIFAMVTMFIDHAGIALIAPWSGGWTPWFTYKIFGTEQYYCLYRLFRDIGRLAFPIFGFLLLEGFLHTSSKKRYTLSLLLFALISELPFDYMLANTWYYPDGQNIYFTLLLAFLCMWGLEAFTGKVPLQLLCAAAAIAAAWIGKTDYSYHGILFLLILYVFRYQEVNQTIFGCLSLYFEWKACFAFIPIRLYNGKRGFIQGKRFKYLFYTFYPAHILLLVILRRLVYG